MLYVIIARDQPDSLPARQASRPAHLQRMRTLLDEGRLILAGPMPAVDNPDPGPAGFLGSVIVAEFDDLQAARAWAEADPYVSGGAWGDVEVAPFKQVLP